MWQAACRRGRPWSLQRSATSRGLGAACECPPVTGAVSIRCKPQTTTLRCGAVGNHDPRTPDAFPRDSPRLWITSPDVSTEASRPPPRARGPSPQESPPGRERDTRAKYAPSSVVAAPCRPKIDQGALRASVRQRAVAVTHLERSEHPVIHQALLQRLLALQLCHDRGVVGSVGLDRLARTRELPRSAPWRRTGSLSTAETKLSSPACAARNAARSPR